MTKGKASLSRIAAFSILGAVLLATAAIPHTPLAFADDKKCTSTISSGTFENVIVPSGNCVLTGDVVVKGNIKQTGGNLVVDGISVGGNVQAISGGSTKVINGATVEGSVQVKETRGITIVRNSVVDGDVQVEIKKDGSIRIVANVVGEDVQVWKNKGGEIILIKNNVIDGNLQCKENTPNPTVINNKASDIECSD